jgi:salicylate hydroxylase
MDRARAAIGEHRSSTRFMYNGPGCHVITYPVGQGTVLNVLAVITDPKAWPHGTQITARGTRQEAEAAFVGWHPTVRAIVSLFPDDMEKWALFDMQESPASSYSRRGVCVAGDAAHASGPHLGAGAAFGIEDALALSSLLTAVDKEAQEGGGGDLSRICCEALYVYDKVRQERTKWLVGATREACDLFHWRYPGCGSDPKKFGEEITLRLHKVWEYDLDEMVHDALSQFATRCKGSSAS